MDWPLIVERMRSKGSGLALAEAKLSSLLPGSHLKTLVNQPRALVPAATPLVPTWDTSDTRLAKANYC